MVGKASRTTRKNFGNAAARKRGESNFLRAFERAYFEKSNPKGIAASEFSLAGFGIADLVWIGWSPESKAGEFSAVSLERQLKRRLLHAFEGKLKDWRRALQQAFRYRYFADKAIVVMPLENAKAALSNIEAFRQAGVGFWSFDTTTKIIREHYTPSRIRAFSPGSRERAIRMLSSKINFGQFRE